MAGTGLPYHHFHPPVARHESHESAHNVRQWQHRPRDPAQLASPNNNRSNRPNCCETTVTNVQFPDGFAPPILTHTAHHGSPLRQIATDSWCEIAQLSPH